MLLKSGWEEERDPGWDPGGKKSMRDILKMGGG